MSKGYVYILSNPRMPGLLKIGKTTRSVNGRANELFQTGVPSPFKVEHSVLSPDCDWLISFMPGHTIVPSEACVDAAVLYDISALSGKPLETIVSAFDGLHPGDLAGAISRVEMRTGERAKKHIRVVGEA